MLCCAKSCCCESFHVTSPLVVFMFATCTISMWRAPSRDVHVAKVCLFPEELTPITDQAKLRNWNNLHLEPHDYLINNVQTCRVNTDSNFVTSVSCILCPASCILRLASLMHTNPQRHKIIHGMCPLGRKDRVISDDVFVENPVWCDFCGCSFGCCLTTHLSLTLCCAVQQKEYIFISVICKTEVWCLSSEQL